MKPYQFSVRQIFVAVSVVCVSIVVLQQVAQYFPPAFFFLVIAAFAVAMLGMGIVVFGGLLAFSIYLNGDDGNRTENLGRCFNLAGIGFLMMTPLLLALVVVPFLLLT